MQQPLVSVVINNYNYGPLLREAIDGALAQTWPRTEVVVVDDGSTDESREIMRGYGDRIRHVLKENGGQASAFNAGYAASRGEIICLLDSDDIIYPNRVAEVVRAFRRWPEADWLRHELEVVDAGRRSLGRRLPDFRPAGPVQPKPQRFIEGRVRVLTSALAFRRDIGDRVFPLATEVDLGDTVVSLVRDADAYLTFRLAAVGGRYASLALVLGEYRRHEGQQYVGATDVMRMVRRQAELGRGVARAFADVVEGDTTPTTYFKHLAVLAALDGARLWSRRRIAPALRGWARAIRLGRASPGLAARQGLAIAFALFLPGVWWRRVLRHQRFARAVERLSVPQGNTPGSESP